MMEDLQTKWLGKELICFDALDSTNTHLKEHAADFADGTAVLAHSQTDGKGRSGKMWHCLPNTGLSFSLLLHNQNVQNLPCLPLVAGLSVCEALLALCGQEFALKWSNDVLYQNKKLCGILCESKISAQGTFAVVGIGVNLTQQQADFDRLELVYATSLFLATNKIYTNMQVAAQICNHFEKNYEIFMQNGFPALAQDYKKRCITLGKPVRILQNGGEQNGTALDIADDGSLLCNIDGKICAVRAGETGVRGLYGYV